MDALRSAGAQPGGAMRDTALLGQPPQDAALAGFAEIGSGNVLPTFGEQQPLARLLHPERTEDNFDQVFQAMLFQTLPSQQTIQSTQLASTSPAAGVIDADLPSNDSAEPVPLSPARPGDTDSTDATSLSVFGLIYNVPLQIAASEAPVIDKATDIQTIETIPATTSGGNQQSNPFGEILNGGTDSTWLNNPSTGTSAATALATTAETGLVAPALDSPAGPIAPVQHADPASVEQAAVGEIVSTATDDSNASKAATAQANEPPAAMTAASAVASIVEGQSTTNEQSALFKTPIKKVTDAEEPAARPAATQQPDGAEKAAATPAQPQTGAESDSNEYKLERTTNEDLPRSVEGTRAKQHASGAPQLEMSGTGLSAATAGTASNQNQTKPLEERATIRSIAERLSEAIVTRAPQEGRSTFEVKLDPPELGSVWLRVTSTRHGLDAQLVVENAATRQLIENNVGSLKDSLRDAGVSLQQFDVSQHGGSQQGWNEPQPVMGFRPAAFRPSTSSAGIAAARGLTTSSSNAIDLMA